MTQTPCIICESPHDNKDELCSYCYESWTNSLTSPPPPSPEYPMPKPPTITEEDTRGNCPHCGCETNKTIHYDNTFVFVAETPCPPCEAEYGGVNVD